MRRFKGTMSEGKISPSSSSHSLDPMGPGAFGRSEEKILSDKTDKKGPEDPEACCNPGSWCAPETRAGGVVVRLGACVLAGIVFGWCLEKGRGG